MNLQMDPLDNPLTTHQIQTGCEMSIEPYLNRLFMCSEDAQHQFGYGSVPTRTRTPRASPEPLLTLFTARRVSIRPALIINFLIDYLISIQLSTYQEVACIVLLAVWRLNHRPDIIAAVPREPFAGACNLPQAGSLPIEALQLIPKCTGVDPPPIVHLVACVGKHLPDVSAEGCPPLPERQTPAPAVGPHQLELRKVVSRDWIKEVYIPNEVPCTLNLDSSDVGYPYGSMNVFRDQSLYMVDIQ